MINSAIQENYKSKTICFRKKPLFVCRLSRFLQDDVKDYNVMPGSLLISTAFRKNAVTFTILR